MNKSIRFAFAVVCLSITALAAVATTSKADGYPLGADVVRTAAPTNYMLAGGSSVLVATNNTQRVNCFIEQMSTNAFWVCETTSPTNANWFYIPGTVGTTWETKRPALWKGPISIIPDAASASLTSKVSVIEGTGSY